MLKNTILVIDDDVNFLDLMTEMLSDMPVKVITCYNSREALPLFKKVRPQVVFCDYLMPEMNGIELMEKILQHDPYANVIIFTGAGSINNAVEAMKKGAYDYIAKPMDIGRITPLIERILESQELREEKEILEDQLDQLYGFKNFIGNSEQIRSVLHQVRQVASSNSTVLITGESGTGKELVANALHYSSSRKGKPFIKVNCAALSESLIES